MQRQATLRAVLFDLDDTLFDHTTAARAALKVVHTEHACFRAWSFEELERVHSTHLEETHLDVLAGTKTVDDARLERFRRVFAAAGVEIDAAALDATAMSYRRAYLESRQPVEGARALLAALASHVRIGIVSNNIRDEQDTKLRLCGFEPYVDALIVSGDVGIAKPDPAIFRIALDRLGVTADEAVMIGDSWSADVQGARDAGIRTIWFNRWGHTCPDASWAVPELTSLHPLDPVLDHIFGDTRQ